MLARSRKKSYHNEIVIAAKMRYCNECSREKCCDRCIHQINENKEFEANLYLLKSKAHNELGYMFPYFKEQDVLFVIIH